MYDKSLLFLRTLKQSFEHRYQLRTLLSEIMIILKVIKMICLFLTENNNGKL